MYQFDSVLTAVQDDDDAPLAGGAQSEWGALSGAQSVYYKARVTTQLSIVLITTIIKCF